MVGWECYVAAGSSCVADRDEEKELSRTVVGQEFRDLLGVSSLGICTGHSIERGQTRCRGTLFH